MPSPADASSPAKASSLAASADPPPAPAHPRTPAKMGIPNFDMEERVATSKCNLAVANLIVYYLDTLKRLPIRGGVTEEDKAMQARNREKIIVTFNTIFKYHYVTFKSEEEGGYTLNERNWIDAESKSIATLFNGLNTLGQSDTTQITLSYQQMDDVVRHLDPPTHIMKFISAERLTEHGFFIDMSTIKRKYILPKNKAKIRKYMQVQGINPYPLGNVYADYAAVGMPSNWPSTPEEELWVTPPAAAALPPASSAATPAAAPPPASSSSSSSSAAAAPLPATASSVANANSFIIDGTTWTVGDKFKYKREEDEDEKEWTITKAPTDKKAWFYAKHDKSQSGVMFVNAKLNGKTPIKGGSINQKRKVKRKRASRERHNGLNKTVKRKTK